MVYYFTSTATDPPSTVYVGKDKFENEDLIAHGWDTDVWFHADKLSSAHVYLRMAEGQTWDALPQELLVDLAQLTKANSIEGNKRDNVTVIYTPWANLRKDGSMDVGQVSFHDHRKVSFSRPGGGLWLTRKLGQEDIRRAEGERHRQQAEQNARGEETRPQEREGRARGPATEEAPGRDAGEGVFPDNPPPKKKKTVAPRKPKKTKKKRCLSTPFFHNSCKEKIER